ncbi:MAG: FkbM family methyltransferase [Chitinophagaceae bacterium]|nr:MAG: FkbM family methyltransferase [Chitinophagaceae bacterium]
MRKIYKKLAGKNILFNHICEVGVFLPEYSNLIDFIRKGVRTTLIEADPDVAAKIRQYYREYPVTVHAVAIFTYNGTVEISRAAESTFVSSVTASPAMVNDRFSQSKQEVFTTECRLFSDLDGGDIDLISIDIEGCEWHVINTMISRPKIISVETHSKAYINPFMNEISSWMIDNNYEVWYKDLSDTVYVRKDQFKPGVIDKLQTGYSKGRVQWKRLKQTVKAWL